MQRSSLVSRAVRVMERASGSAIALCKEQKDLAVLWGVIALSKSERSRPNQAWLREGRHPTLGIRVMDYPINKDPSKEGWTKDEFREKLQPFVDAAKQLDLVGRMKALYTTCEVAVSRTADEEEESEEEEED